MENITTKAFGNSSVENDIAYFKKVKRTRIWGQIGRIFIYAILILWTIGTLFPFLWTLLNSFKLDDAVKAHPFGFSDLTIHNYARLFKGEPINIWNGYLWSILISGTVVIVTALIAALASFFVARYQGWQSKVVYSLVIACMMFPIFSTIYPVFEAFSKMGWTRGESGFAFLTVVLPQVAGNIMFTTTLLTGFIKSLPIEVEESAYIDGASTMRTVFTIVFPMIKSAFATSAIFIFIWSFNDLYLQKLMLDSHKVIRPLCLIMAYMTTPESGFKAGLAFAAIMMMCLPITIVYICLQRQIISGLTAGAVKG